MSQRLRFCTHTYTHTHTHKPYLTSLHVDSHESVPNFDPLARSPVYIILKSQCPEPLVRYPIHIILKSQCPSTFSIQRHYRGLLRIR